MPSYTIEYTGSFAAEGEDSQLEMIMDLLERWKEGEIKCYGIMAFLQAQGCDFDGLTDEEINKDTHKELRASIAAAAQVIFEDSDSNSEEDSEGNGIEEAHEESRKGDEEIQKAFVEAIQYVELPLPECTSLLDVIRDIMLMWPEGNIDAYGTLAFLKEKGHDFGLVDDEADDSTHSALMYSAAAAVNDICREGSEEVQRAYIASLKYIKVIES